MPTPRTCPVCGTDAPLRIVYGLPSPELFDDPTIALGGCTVSSDDPTWRCRNTDCAHEFGSSRRRSPQPRVSRPRTVAA